MQEYFFFANLMLVKPIKTPLVREGEDLDAFILAQVPALQERSVVVIASKIVALAEGRTAPLEDKHHLMLQEAQAAAEVGMVWLTIKDGMVLPFAGVDESNVDGKLLLLPKDSYAAAEHLRNLLMERDGLQELGIIISDCALMPLRMGVLAAALGYAGFRGIRDYRGQPDLFGRPLVMTSTNIADGLATAAALEMGEGAESQPLAVVTDARVEFCETIDKPEMFIDPQVDMFAPLWKQIMPPRT